MQAIMPKKAGGIAPVMAAILMGLAASDAAHRL